MAGHRLGGLEGGGVPPPFQCIPEGGGGLICESEGLPLHCLLPKMRTSDEHSILCPVFNIQQFSL